MFATGERSHLLATLDSSLIKFPPDFDMSFLSLTRLLNYTITHGHRRILNDSLVLFMNAIPMPYRMDELHP